MRMGSKKKMAARKLLSETSGELIIRSGDIEVRLSRKNGCITGIYDARTGKPLCTVADSPGCERLFRILAMRRGQRGYVCDAHKQTDVKLKERVGGLVIVYDRLIFNGHECACSAVVTIEKSADSELRFSIFVDNRGDNPVYEIQFPMLPGWQNREGEPTVQLTAGAKWQSTVGQLPRFGFAIHGGRQVSVGYPGSMMYMPWLDFSLSGSGLSMINYMERPYTGGIAGVNLAGHEKGSLECYWWIHYPLIKKGGRWNSPPIGVSLRNGDWHNTADRYYKWFRSNIGVKIQQPEFLRTAIGFQNIYLRDFDGNRVNESNSLPEHARAGLKYGINHLCVWDYLLSLIHI